MTGRAANDSPSLTVPACLVALAVASGALACSFYFRGEHGDYNLYYVEVPEFGMNEYVPGDASRALVFPRLPLFLAIWSVGVGAGWLAAAWALARRDACRLRAALARTGASFTPLIALLVVPAHHAFGWPLTLAPVFLLILCVGLCVAAMAYHARPAFGGRFARAVFSGWGVAALCLVCAVGFAFLLLRQYRGLHLGYMDSGMFAESLYHASQGEALRTNGEKMGVALDAHCFLMLAPLSYLYRLWPAMELLLILQPAVVASGGMAVYLLGRSVVQDRFASWCAAAAYLVSPATAFVILPSDYGFRPMAMLSPLILWALVFLERRREAWFFLFCLVALLTKETAAPMVVMVGVFAALRHRRFGLGAATMALGVGYFVLATHVILPYVFGAFHGFTGLLSHFGSSAGEVVLNVARDPLEFLSYTLGVRVKLFFLLHMVVPVLLVPLLSPSALLVGAASFAILTMANYYGKYTLYIGAQSPVLAGVYLATVYGLRNLAWRDGWVFRRLVPRAVGGDRERLLRAAAAGVVAAAALSGYFFFVRSVEWSAFRASERGGTVAELRRIVPRESTVVASCLLGAHFTDQRDLNIAPRNLMYADYVVLDLRDDWAGLSAMAECRRRLLESPDHGVVFGRDHFIVFERGAADAGLPVPLEATEPLDLQYRVGRDIDGLATLLGYDVQQTPDGAALTLYWRCEAADDTDRAVRLVLATDARGESGRFGWRYLPAGGLLPTWAWEAGDIVVDRVTIPGVRPARDRPPLLDVAFEVLRSKPWDEK